jgi:hypothetical protein
MIESSLAERTVVGVEVGLNGGKVLAVVGTHVYRELLHLSNIIQSSSLEDHFLCRGEHVESTFVPLEIEIGEHI